MRILAFLLFAGIGLASSEVLHRVKRVIGGEESETEEWPWVASLSGTVRTELKWGFIPVYKSYTCGASVLNDRWLLSAAHCFEGNAIHPHYWKATMGTRRRDNYLASYAMHLLGRLFDRDDWLRYRIKPDKIIVHPDYRGNQNWLNDIALIRLGEDIPSGEDVSKIRKVNIPEQGNTTFPPDGFKCHMVGWGCHKRGGGAVEVAHDIVLPKFPDLDCGAIYGVTTRTRFCAGESWGNSGICSGDSGGPLTCFDGEHWVQTGIASFTSAERPEKMPGAFTRVAMFSNWIRDTIDANS